MRVLVIGPGYIGFQLAANLVQRGHEVSALRRTAQKKSDLRRVGVQPLQSDITEPGSLQRLPRNWDWVINCVSSSRGTVDEYRKVYLDGTRNLLSWLSKSPPRKFVYTSSTGVYGQNDGSVVTESSPTVPESETGKVLVETENMLLLAAREKQFPAVILRVSGIYGPGRAYWLKKFMEDEGAIDNPGERIINMVHREDVVGAIVAALEKGQGGEIYNVTDNEPVSQRDLAIWVGQRPGKPLPKDSKLQTPNFKETPNPRLQTGSRPSSETGESERAGRKRVATSKRVSNARLKTELGYEFKHPTFREGFAAILS